MIVPLNEYDFLKRVLIVRDVDADVVVDYLPDTLPNLQEPREAAAARPDASRAKFFSGGESPRVEWIGNFWRSGSSAGLHRES